MGKRILIVDGESETVAALGNALREAGFDLTTARAGNPGLMSALTDAVSLVVLEMGPPITSGFEFCRKITTSPATRHLPVIVLTAHAGADDRISGLEAGADDYVTKPFSPREVALRVACSIKRTTSLVPSLPKLRVGEFEVDESRHELRVGNELVNLTALEFRLLTLFLENVGFVLERGRLLDKVWGYSNNVTTRTVDTHVMRLRAKLGHAGGKIETVRGVGYRLTRPEHMLDIPLLGVEREERALVLR
jgi:two-component system, OmpR family, phosphate regulon response regulator PhoB